MKYSRFEDLPVWKATMEPADRVYKLTRHPMFAQPGDLRSQLRRAALSVSNNIAEGFERGSTAELLSFVYIARGSAGEVRSMLHFVIRCIDLGSSTRPLGDTGSQISDLKSEMSNLHCQIGELIALAESCSRQLRGWAATLQDSDIKGQRHLSEKTRKAYEQQRTADAFWQKLEDAHRERMAQWQESMSAGADKRAGQQHDRTDGP